MRIHGVPLKIAMHIW